MRRQNVLRFLFACVVSTASCSDPVHDAEVDALGPETDGIRPGPRHRAGQPCLTCHGGAGPAGREFSIAGTVFKTADAREGIAGVTVSVSDSTASGAVTREATTNDVGNFFFEADSFTPVFPLHDIRLDYPGLSGSQLMHTRVGRNGSCGSCHFDSASGAAGGRDTPGHVYLVLEQGDLPGESP
jgi:hypothetical protein